MYIYRPLISCRSESLMKVLQVAALAKVDVRLMLPEKSDSPVLQLASHSYIKPMLKAGVRFIFTKKDLSIQKRLSSTTKFSTVGSTNLDFRSFDHNFEVNALCMTKNWLSK